MFVSEVAGVAAPDSGVSRAAVEVCAAHSPDWLVAHSQRAYFFGAAYAASAGIEYDAELFFVAALLHDIALTPPFDAHELSFEDAGGRVAWVFGAGAGWSAARRDRVAEIIVLHMRDDVPASQDPESHLLQVSTTADVSGRGLELFSPSFTAALLDQFPRKGFAQGFLECATAQATRKPQSSSGELMRTGWAQRITTNALDR